MDHNLLERVAHFADIDTRRALGFAPGRLPRTDFDPRPMPPVEYRYYINEKKLWYFEMNEYQNFFFEVFTDVELLDPAVPMFRHGPDSHKSCVVYFDNRKESCNVKVNAAWQQFRTAGHPIWIQS